MGIKYIREYKNIISDLTDLLIEINDIYTFFGMPLSTWKYLSASKKRNYVVTLADDLFFALGTTKEFEMGSSKIVYNSEQQVLEIFNINNKIGTVNLI